MYFYIYDSFLNDKKYQDSVNKIETRLTDLGISGKTEKLTLLKSLSETVKEVLKKGAKTIIAVGNDATVSKIISALPSLNVIIGIIPLGSGNEIAKRLGIPEGEAACDIISARLIEKIDLGKANNYYFISHLSLTSEKDITLDCGKYNISSLISDGQITICNFSNEIVPKSGKVCNPKDGILEAIFTPANKTNGIFGIFNKTYIQSSVFPFKKLKIKCSRESLPVIADGHVTIKTPISVEVVPKKLKVIVGKNRMF